MIYKIRCETTDPKGAALHSAPFPTLEEAQASLIRWKRREDWLSLEIWKSDPMGVFKTRCVHREERTGNDDDPAAVV